MTAPQTPTPDEVRTAFDVGYLRPKTDLRLSPDGTVVFTAADVVLCMEITGVDGCLYRVQHDDGREGIWASSCFERLGKIKPISAGRATPTPGIPLSAESDVRAGDYVRVIAPGGLIGSGSLRVKCGEIAEVVEAEGGFVSVRGESWRSENFTFIGRPDAEGWMTWSGGENPVPGQMVECRIRRGWRDKKPFTSDRARWAHDGGNSDIIAFRLTTPSDQGEDAGRTLAKAMWGIDLVPATTTPASGSDGLEGESVALMHPFWVSWWGEPGTFELHRPWWVSGERDDGKASICAAVLAQDEFTARLSIQWAHDDKDAVIEWRFVEEKPKGWSPFCDRFVQADWMRWPETTALVTREAAEKERAARLAAESLVAALKAALEMQASEMEEIHLFLQGFDADEVGELAPYDVLVKRIRDNAIAARQALKEGR